MKIKDLIKDLQKHDPETNVLFGCSVDSTHTISNCRFTGDIYIDKYTKKQIEKEIEKKIEITSTDMWQEINTFCNSLEKKNVVITVCGISTDEREVYFD